jgi:type I restriction enzyme S subunit
MRSNYKAIGELVERVDIRNTDGSIDTLIGLSIEKCFIRSVANTIGTDLTKYKKIQKNQFAVSLMQVSRDEKIPVACLKEFDEAIMSPAYSIFQIIDENVLLPEYLDMWFKRSEFDREAAFIAVGGVRGSMPWEEFAKMKLPVPPIEKQRSIVNAYQTITDRIALKRKINEKLVTIGIASIQKNIGRGALINLTDADMERVILPEGFSIKTVSEFCKETKSGSTPSRTNNEYWGNGTIPWVKSGEVHNNITLQTDEHITPLGLSESSTKLLPRDTVLMAMYGVTAGEVGYLAIEATTNQAICGMICHTKAESAYLYFSLIQSQTAISRLSNGGAQDNLSKNFIDGIKIVVPPSEYIEKLNLVAIIQQMILNTKEIALLEELQSTVLAQLASH